MKEKLKSLINSIKIPRLLDFLLNKSKEEMDKNAPKENWVRLGLGKISNIGLPVWFIIALPFALLAFYFGSEILARAFFFLRDFILLVPFGVIIYFIHKTFK